MIALEAVSARRAPLALATVSLAWGAGSHAVVGARADGGPLLLGVIAGLAPVRSGTVKVLGRSPTEAAVRRQVALVALEPALPEALRVHEALAVAAAVRGDPPREASERLSVLGIEALAERAVRSLSRAEARAVALAEAITSTAVRILLVEEPLVAVDPRAAGRIPRALRERGNDGCAVVLATSSVRDASEIADDVVTLRGGAVAWGGAWSERLAAGNPDGARVHVILRDAADATSLASALAREGAVEGIERDGGAVRIRGKDASALARAAGQAAIEAEVAIAELRVEHAGLRGPV